MGKATVQKRPAGKPKPYVDKDGGGSQHILFVATLANWELGQVGGWEATATACGQTTLWCPTGLPLFPTGKRKPDKLPAFKLKVQNLAYKTGDFMGFAHAKVIDGAFAFWMKKTTLKSMVKGAYRYRGKL